MNTGARTNPFDKPVLIPVHGEEARAAYSAWNDAMHKRALHELRCFGGCQNQTDCCEEGGRLARIEQQASIDWYALALDSTDPSEVEAIYIEADDTTSDLLRGLWIGGSISAILWGGIALVWFVFHVLSRGAR